MMDKIKNALKINKTMLRIKLMTASIKSKDRLEKEKVKKKIMQNFLKESSNIRGYRRYSIISYLARKLYPEAIEAILEFEDKRYETARINDIVYIYAGIVHKLSRSLWFAQHTGIISADTPRLLLIKRQLEYHVYTNDKKVEEYKKKLREGVIITNILYSSLVLFNTIANGIGLGALTFILLAPYAIQNKRITKKKIEYLETMKEIHRISTQIKLELFFDFSGMNN